MIPSYLVHYLRHHHVPYARRTHRRAVGAQRLAAELHVSGHGVGKAVILDVDGTRWIALVPASEMVDEDRLAALLDARHIGLVPEEQLEELFPQCECGAGPPFGKLYCLPVVADARIAREERILLRGGSHEETLELAFADYARLERPLIGDIGRLQRGLEPSYAWLPAAELPAGPAAG